MSIIRNHRLVDMADSELPDTERPYVVYCRRGRRVSATALLQRRVHRPRIVAGGLCECPKISVEAVTQ